MLWGGGREWSEEAFPASEAKSWEKVGGGQIQREVK